MASAASVMLPTESVVLISINWRKMSRDRRRVESSSCAPDATAMNTNAAHAIVRAASARLIHICPCSQRLRCCGNIKGIPIMIRSAICLCLALSVAPLAAEPRGQKEFVQSCGFCHGDDATGSRAPDLVRSPLVNKDSGGDLIGPSSAAAVRTRACPPCRCPTTPFRISSPSCTCACWPAAKSSHVGGDYPIERLLTGNADAGRAYFNGAGKCASCHSPTGDLAGIARKYAPLYLEERILAPRPPGTSARHRNHAFRRADRR